MTLHQKRCLDFIIAFWKERGYAPSFTEIQDFLGAKSKSTVASVVHQLERRGFIKRIPHSSRSITVVNQDHPGI